MRCTRTGKSIRESGFGVIDKIRILIDNNKGTLRQRLLSGAVWSVAGAFLAKGITLISYIVLAQLIAQETYGELGIIRSTLNMFTAVSGMGIGYTASKYIAQYRNSDPLFAGNIYALSNFLSVVIGGIGVLCLILFSDRIASGSLGVPHLASGIRIGAMVLFFTTINGIQSGALAGFESFRAIAVNQLISGIVQAILMIVLGYRYGLEGCVGALGIGCMILGILNYKAINADLVRNKIPHSLKNVTAGTFGVLWRFSFPALLSSLMVIPVLWWAKTVLANTSGYAEMAIFDVADQWSMTIVFIPQALAQIILPILSNTLAEGTPDQYIRLVKINLIINFVVSSLIALVIVILSPWILGMYGAGFVKLPPLMLMMAVSVFMSICNVVGQVIASQDKMWIGFAFNMGWAVWIVVFTQCFKHLGATGLALAIACSYLLHFIGQTVYLRIKLKTA